MIAAVKLFPRVPMAMMALVAMALAATPFTASAQQPAIPVIAEKTTTPTRPSDPLTAAAERLLQISIPAADDPDKALRTILDPVVGRTAGGEAMLDLAGPLLDRIHDPRGAIPLLERFLASDPHPLAADVAQRMLANLHLRFGDAAAARAVDAYGEYVRRLIAIGPFGDEQDYYTGVAFPPEFRFPTRAQTLSGRFGPVAPRAVERSPYTSRIRLQAPGVANQGCFYGLYRFRAAGPVTGYIELSTTGSFELFLDGRRLTRVNRLLDRTKLAVQRIPLRVAGGDGAPHQLLIKTTLQDNSQLALRFLDARGAPLPGLTEVFGEPITAPRHHRPDANLAPELGPFMGGLALLERRASELEGDDSAGAHAVRIAAAIAAARGRTSGRALAAIRAIERTPPPPGTNLEFAYAHANQLTTVIPEALRQSRLDEVVQRTAKALPDHHAAALLRSRQLANRDQKEAAIQLLQARIGANRAGPATHLAHHRLLSELRAGAEAKLALDRWRAALPADPRAARLEAGRLNRLGAPRAALAVLSKALDQVPNDRLRRDILAVARQLGDRDLAVQMIDQLQIRAPDGPTRGEEIGYLLERLEPDGTEWVAAYRRVAEHPHAFAGQVIRSGEALLRSGDTPGAVAAYRRALRMNPRDSNLRRVLARLAPAGPEAKVVEAGFAPFRRNAHELIERFQPGDAETTATSTLVLNQRLISFGNDGSMRQETHLVRRINDRKGVEEYQNAERAARANQVLELRTLLRKKTESQRTDQPSDGWQEYRPTLVDDKNYSMPRLEPGAFLEMRFQDDFAPDAPRPIRSGEFQFQATNCPIALAELVVILPAGFAAKHGAEFRMRNFDGHREQRDMPDGRVAHIFRMESVERLASERLPPPVNEILPVIHFGQDRALGPAERSQHLTLAYYSAETATTKLHANQALQELTARQPNADDLTKARTLWRYTCEQIAGQEKTQDATSSLLQKQGSRFYTLAALLRTVNVPFTPALSVARTDSQRVAAEPLFDGDLGYGITGIRIEPRGAEPVWHQSNAARYQPLGLLGFEQLGAAALLGPAPGRIQITRLPREVPGSGTGIRISGTVTITSKGVAEFAAEAEFAGDTGYFLTERLRTLEDKIVTLASRQVASQLFRGWSIRKVELRGVKEKGEPLHVTATLRKRKGLTKSGDTLVADLPIAKSQLLRRFGDRGERKLPLRITTPTASRHQVEIDVGPERRIVNLPPPLHIRRMLVDFELSFERVNDHRVRVHHAMSVQAGQIPASMFSDWTRVLRNLDLAEKRRITVVAR